MDDEPATEILRATYRALCTHGYANLTLQDIAAESELSKASIHYHYESKDELFAAFLEYLYERHTDHFESIDGDSAPERLRSLLSLLLTEEGDAPVTEFGTAMLEVKAQAPYDDAIRARLEEFDELLFGHLRDILADGVESGAFDDRVEPVRDAELLTATITGAHTREVAIDHGPDRLYEALTEYERVHLLDEDAPEVTH
ncbi:TetR/AcrR family transcriptional regulator [Halorarum halobium]|uniref:TetR/AcrR family transcriptional regulator n=1 Tax=Halorarum halobium TaxID=3075121 RepID=UPI0028AFA5B5|nr:TetR/AcrR family transcriptional regulator [Halobaculum sp. XH14]